MQLARIALVFTAISNIWLVVFISHQRPDWSGPLGHDLSLGLWLVFASIVATGLYAFGMILNDLLDMPKDKVLEPERPLVSGRISPGAAIVLAATALIAALGSSWALGWLSLVLCMICAGLIVFYNALAKHIPGIGLLNLGLIRGLHMMIANPLLFFCWPAWLSMTHVIGLSAASYRLENKRPPLAGPYIWLMTAGWAFATLGLIAWMNHHAIDSGGVLLWAFPLIATGIFITLALRIRDRASGDREAGKSIMKTGLLWLIVYDVTWLIGLQHWIGAATLIALVPAAIGSMALMRQGKAALSDPGSFIRDDRDAHPS